MATRLCGGVETLPDDLAVLDVHIVEVEGEARHESWAQHDRIDVFLSEHDRVAIAFLRALKIAFAPLSSLFLGRHVRAAGKLPVHLAIAVYHPRPGFTVLPDREVVAVIVVVIGLGEVGPPVRTAVEIDFQAAVMIPELGFGAAFFPFLRER